ncbi:MAG: type II toxin-antitoxin system RelE/ParE family toxin [Cyanobacteria bacterium]|nr:type II toxin-antitoxin system RelE/ParE family toxin [Cyanobacteriota bacterium]
MIEVIASPTFNRNTRSLKKKYRNVLKDVDPLLEQLENGETSGDQVVGTGYSVFKVRVKNSDNQKGKSGGYRVIYYLKTADKTLLLTIYSKSELDDVAAEDLIAIIEEYDRTSSHSNLFHCQFSILNSNFSISPFAPS